MIGIAMNSPRRFFFLPALGLAVALTAHPARAQSRVGEAAMVKNEVLRVAAATTPISVGDALLRDETVRTGLESAARLVMADSTNLSLGPNASLKLDRTVFDDEHHYRDVAIRLTSGAFRFVTGHSEKAAYKITTPLATIGVRGTVLDILSQRRQDHCGVAGRRIDGVHVEPAVHRPDPARRHRDHHLERRPHHDPEDQQPALDLCRDLQPVGRALHRHPVCGRDAGDAAGQ
ncbi:hypothetical protein ACVINW_000354 [Bradyrhizobium sp. USDA 4461]